MTIEKAVEMLAQAELSEQPLGHCSETGKPVYLKVGRLDLCAAGKSGREENEEPSLLKGMH